MDYKKLSILSERDVEMLTAIHEAKALPGEIYPDPLRLGITKKELQSLRRRGLTDKVFGDILTMKARTHLTYSKGENPIEGLEKAYVAFVWFNVIYEIMIEKNL